MKTKFLATVLALSAIAMGSLGCGSKGGQQAYNNQNVKWPTKPVQIIVPYSAGGDTDFNARVMAKYLEKKLLHNLSLIREMNFLLVDAEREIILHLPRKVYLIIHL